MQVVFCFPLGISDLDKKQSYRNAILSKTISEMSCGLQVLLAKLKADGKFYAVKVLQKKVILKKKEVCICVFFKLVCPYTQRLQDYSVMKDQNTSLL